MITHEDINLVPTADFTAEVLLAAPDLPVEIAESFVADTVHDFLRRTSLLSFWVPVDIQACVRDYFVDVPGCYNLNYLMRVCQGGDCGCAGNTGTVITRDRPCVVQCGIRQLRFLPPNRIEVLGTPQEDRSKAFWVQVSVTPKRDSCLVPGEVYERHRDAIVLGATARVLRVPNNKWSNPIQAKEFMLNYERAVGTANTERILNRTMGVINARPRGPLV